MRPSGSFRRVAPRSVTAAGSVLLGVVFATSLASCAVAKLARGTKGTDMSAIQPGASRATFESVLGFPVRSWISSTGVLWCVYQFDP